MLFAMMLPEMETSLSIVKPAAAPPIYGHRRWEGPV
jgi:hypothetical protein